MGPSYAGILGPIAFVAMLARGLIEGSSANSVLISASVCLVTFAAIGYVTGRLADQIVLESVKQRFDKEMKVREQAEGATQQA